MSEPVGESAWSLEVDADQIGWLTLDRARRVGQYALPRRAARAGAAVAGTGAAAAARARDPLGQALRLHCRRRYPRIHQSRFARQRRSSIFALASTSSPRIEALPYPTVAAIHGFALGGGLELALACRYRVAVGDSKLALGLPEVQLGIHPGFGGTVRSVRLLGVRPAMGLMLTGRSVRADQALKLGLVDRLVAARRELADAARHIVMAAPAPHRPPLQERLLSWPGVRALAASGAGAPGRARMRRREHYPAPYAMIDLWARHGARGDAAFVAEAHSFAALIRSSTRTQPDPCLPAAGSPQGPGRQGPRGLCACARHRRRGHGWRYRGLVRAARS